MLKFAHTLQNMIVAGRIGWVAVCRGAATLAVVMAVAACTSNGNAPPTHLVPIFHKSEVLGRGAVHGKHWVLTVASSGDGNLCMAVNDRLSARAQARTHAFQGDGCGFGPFSDRISGPFLQAKSGALVLMWGPAPAGAVRVRLDTFRQKAQPAKGHGLGIPGCQPSTPAHLWVPVAHRLPGWTEPGGWFITHTNVSVSGCGYLDATFYNRHGQKIDEHWW